MSTYEDCIEKSVTGRHKKSKRCKHVNYPNHPRTNKRKPCGTLLLKKVRNKSGYKLLPIKAYPYKPLKCSIEQMVQRNGFIEKCEQWRNRSISASYLADVYDGATWRRFNSTEMNKFLSSPYCYLMTLNVDWFQPFERGIYSVGAIYLTVQNLPRNERYKTENIILIGVIPGPKEPTKTINSYLAPLVHELNHAWVHGFEVTNQDNTSVFIKVALSCVTCDIPATRKVCGFLSHHASMGCNKCLKKFPVRDKRTYYHGFNINTEEWTSRTLSQHVADLEEIKKEVTKTKIKEKESQYGIRYSVLLDLPYFDPVDFIAIDVMHNLYLGSGKHVFDVWIDKKILSKQNLAVLQNRINEFKVPCDIGRVPSTMSCYKAFTANQWKYWITLYSSVLLKDLLPGDDYRCWKCFVRCCMIINSYCLKESDVTTAHLLLQEFCSQFEALYGQENCSFNMHLHLHLNKTLLDYGPAHASWCYAFERFNGLLGSYSTNNKDIELQIMKRFSEHQAIYSEDTIYEKYNSILPYTHRYQEEKSRTIANSFVLLQYSTYPLETIQTFAWTEDMEAVQPLGLFYEDVFTAEEAQQVSDIYQQLYYNRNITASIIVTHHKFGRVLLAGDTIGSNMPGRHSKSSAVIMAYWPSRGQNLGSIDYSTMQVGTVQYFVRHKFRYCISGSFRYHEEVMLLACVKWKKLHTHFDWFGSSAIVCENIDEFESTVHAHSENCSKVRLYYHAS